MDVSTCKAAKGAQPGNSNLTLLLPPDEDVVDTPNAGPDCSLAIGVPSLKVAVVAAGVGRKPAKDCRCTSTVSITYMELT